MNSTLPPGFQLRPAVNGDSPAVTELIVNILTAYGLAADPSTTDRDLADLEGYYHRAGGGSFDVLLDSRSGRIIGTVGLSPMDKNTVELRKMYLDAGFRGRGFGRFLLEHALAQARHRGFQRVVLETATALTEALHLYRAAGFQPCAAEHPCAKRCDLTMELRLQP